MAKIIFDIHELNSNNRLPTITILIRLISAHRETIICYKYVCLRLYGENIKRGK
jgi:hypothetical protein